MNTRDAKPSSTPNADGCAEGRRGQRRPDRYAIAPRRLPASDARWLRAIMRNANRCPGCGGYVIDGLGQSIRAIGIDIRASFTIDTTGKAES